nr:uL13 family ribosomal protein [Mycoplasmopsis bovis]
MKKPNKKWFVVDAENQVVGRLAAFVASVLRGKTKPTFTPNADMGDYVIIINAEKAYFYSQKRRRQGLLPSLRIPWRTKKYYSCKIKS